VDSVSSGSGIHRNASSDDDHGPEADSFNRTTRHGSSACQRELDEIPGPRDDPLNVSTASRTELERSFIVA